MTDEFDTLINLMTLFVVMLGVFAFVNLVQTLTTKQKVSTIIRDEAGNVTSVVEKYE